MLSRFVLVPHLVICWNIESICTLLFSAISLKSRRLQPTKASAKWHAYGNSMDVGGGGSAKALLLCLLTDGTAHTVELHWYEATGIGPKEYKIKRLLD
jgi:hypothetical protein